MENVVKALKSKQDSSTATPNCSTYRATFWFFWIKNKNNTKIADKMSSENKSKSTPQPQAKKSYTNNKINKKKKPYIAKKP